jgi:hypothetical protein
MGTSHFSLPDAEPIRDCSLNIRLTEIEKETIAEMARELHVRPSTLARHLVLEAVRLFNAGALTREGGEKPDHL